MQITDHQAAANLRPALLDRLLDEAAGLGEAARDAIVLQTHATEAPPMERLRNQHELSVIASHLGFSVAWLLEQKAILAGELDRAGPPDDLRTELARPAADATDLDPHISGIGERTRRFAERISRLAGN
ncbi:MAG: hypothetical protein AAFX81_06490 [Pseudomonadota bacterium]